jgi:hypothetical protein
MTAVLCFRFKNSGALLYAAWSRTSGRVFRLVMTLIIVCISLLNWTGSSAARSFEVKKKVGDYEVGLIIDRNPPIIGENHIEIEIKDGSGRPVIDAKVLVNYYMPPMPRMAPMNYTTEAKLKRDKYRATMNIIMAGPWNIAVKINRGGRMTTAKFNVDAQ